MTRRAIENPKTYLAGISTAKADHRHGMSPDAMVKVPQADDNQDWAEGYADQTAAYATQCDLAKRPRITGADCVHDHKRYRASGF